MDNGRSKAKESVAQADKAGVALEAIKSTIDTISEINLQIATASEEQSTVAEDINNNIENIHMASIQTADDAAQTAQSSNQLSNLAARLQDLTCQFKL